MFAFSLVLNSLFDVLPNVFFVVILSCIICRRVNRVKYKLKENYNEKKYFLVYHTVFKLNENIDFLEEYLVYHFNLGVEHFYLYDNSNSIGRNGSSIKVNKYGFQIHNRDESYSASILEKYRDYITYMKWSPRDKVGNIVYGYAASIFDFIGVYGNEAEWCAFLDLDEFLFSSSNINVVDYLKRQKANLGQIKMVQKKFKERRLITENLVTQDYECIDDINIGLEWAPKSIVRVKSFYDLKNMHNIFVTNKTIFPDPSCLRFNHYNVSSKLLAWMKEFYGSDKEFELNSNDYGMAIHKEKIEQMIDERKSACVKKEKIHYDRVCRNSVECYIPGFNLRMLYFKLRRKVLKMVNKYKNFAN